MNITPALGGDPEIFVVDKKDKLVSASKIIEGKVTTHYGEVVNDGMQIELHPSPSTCREVLANNIFDCMKSASEISKAKGLSLSCDFTHAVEEKVLKELPAEVSALGCEPDYSAYSGKIKILNIDGSKHFKRYCGGHIHLGVAQQYFHRTDVQGRLLYKKTAEAQFHEHADEMVRMFDYLVGNTAVLLDHDESNVERRKVYGQAGSYRYQPHGIEYRTLSNFWLRHTSILSLMYVLARLAAKLTPPTFGDFKVANLTKFMSEVPEKLIEEAINNNDYKLAEQNFKKIFNLLMKEDQSNIELLDEVDAKYILYLNKFPNKSVWYNKNYAENWGLEKLACFNGEGHANWGWRNTIDKIVGWNNLHKDKDFIEINLN